MPEHTLVCVRHMRDLEFRVCADQLALKERTNMAALGQIR
jgi:hypothetical protein